MTDNNYRNRIASQLRVNVREATDVNLDYQYLLRNKIIGNEWNERKQETKLPPKEQADFKRQTKNLEYMAIPDVGHHYRLQGL